MISYIIVIVDRPFFNLFKGWSLPFVLFVQARGTTVSIFSLFDKYITVCISSYIVQAIYYRSIWMVKEYTKGSLLALPQAVHSPSVFYDRFFWSLKADLMSFWYHIARGTMVSFFSFFEKASSYAFPAIYYWSSWHKVTWYFVEIRPLLRVNDGTNEMNFFWKSICVCLLCFILQKTFQVLQQNQLYGWTDSRFSEYSECNFDLERWMKLRLFFFGKKKTILS